MKLTEIIEEKFKTKKKQIKCFHFRFENVPDEIIENLPRQFDESPIKIIKEDGNNIMMITTNDQEDTGEVLIFDYNLITTKYN